MRGSTAAPGSALVPPSGATPTIAMPERKRKRKGMIFQVESYLILKLHAKTYLIIYGHSIWFFITYHLHYNRYYDNQYYYIIVSWYYTELRVNYCYYEENIKLSGL